MAGYIDVKKEFVNNRPQTTYSITELGKNEFEKFVDYLNTAIKSKS